MKSKILIIISLIFVIIITSFKLNETFDDNCEDIEIIECNADFGTNIGDRLCCGQTGRLTKDDFKDNLVCPMTRPKCSQFDCDTKRGNCIVPSSDGYKINRIKSN